MSTPISSVQARVAELERDAARFPDERREILLEAAEQWQMAGEFDRAVAILEPLIAEGGADGEWATVSLIDVCLERGDEAQGRALMDTYRKSGPTEFGPVELVADMLADRGESAEALRWYEIAVRMLSDEDLAKIGTPGGTPSMRGMMLGRRQQLRQKLGLMPDAIDRVADIAERNRLDFVDTLEKTAETWHDQRSSTHRPRTDKVSMLVWQRAELAALIRRWPQVFAEAIGYAQVEARLRTLAQEKHTSRITLVLGQADGLAEFLAASGGDPAEESDRLAYADKAAEQGLTMPWPPGRNEPCWCGSGRKYKKCCGLPSPS